MRTGISKAGAVASGAAVVIVAAALGLACDGATDPGSDTYLGPQVAVGDGVAQTELVFDGSKRLRSVAVIFTKDALNGLPTSGPAVEHVLPMPADAPATVFDHVSLDWQPQGHPPPMVYTHPHLDVHFYFISLQQRNAMTPADPEFAAKATQMPAPDETPPNYAADAVGIPRMGTHWTDTRSPEHHGGLFTNTLIYGFYEGKMVFIEPMITRDHLLTEPAEALRLSVPERYPRPGAYPKEYRVTYDDAAGVYRIELREFVVQD